MMQHSFVNLISWILAMTGCVAFLAAFAGVIYLLLTPAAGSVSEISSSLHDTYYVIRHSRAAIWPLLLCVALSSAIAIIGYMRTDFFMARTIRQQMNQGTQH